MLSNIIILFFTTFQINTAQIPDHLDLQRIDTVEYSGQQYIVLKPTTHFIVDHFQNFALKKSLNEFPTKRVFLDKSGFRHFWNHFQPPNGIEARRADVGNNSNSNISESKNNETGAVQKNETETVQKNETGTVHKNENEAVKTEEVSEERPSQNQTATVNDLREGTEVVSKKGDRPIISTTFYCPYIGVIHMSAFND